MRFNGIDPCTLHRGISIARETLPGMAPRDVETVRGSGTETLGGIEEKRGEYVVEINIAGKSKEEAYKMRALIAKWARSSGEKTARIEPTHWHGMAYDGIAERIGDPVFNFGFGVLEVVFALPDAKAYEMAASHAHGSSGRAVIQIGGGEACRPVIQQVIAKGASSMTWKLDGKTFLVLNQSVKAGQTVEADFSTGGLTIDGVHAENKLDYTATNWKPGFLPGRHTISSSDTGALSARWNNRWA